MVRKSSILVLANRTALSAGLETALRARTDRGPASFTLVVPIGRGTKAREQAAAIAAQLAESGLEIRGVCGDTDPLTAVLEAWNPAEYDEIIVSTLPAWKSRWMKTGLPQRIERQTGALVRHFEAREAPPAAHEAAHINRTAA
ncbi:MAG: hypothetical protein WAK93_15150 [Solirubrobacteraceae bacterium]